MKKSYAEQLVELATLYFNALQANPNKPDLAAFTKTLEETPLHNRPFYNSFLNDMIQQINLSCCHHPEASLTEFKHDKQKCKDCGYTRIRWWVDNHDDDMMNSGDWHMGSWTPQPFKESTNV